MRKLLLEMCKRTFVTLLFVAVCTLGLHAQWTEVADPLKARYEGPAILKDGKLYIIGGFGPGYSLESEISVYDPGSDTWSVVTTIPIEVTHIGVALVNNNEIWVAGGRLWNDEQIDDVQIYNIATNTWYAGPDLPEPRGAGALVLVDNTLHYFGGFGPKPAVDDFDDHWALDLNNQGVGWQTKADFPLKRHHFGAAAIGGKIYAVGGQIDHDNTAKDNNFVHSYDPGSDTWTQLNGIPGVNSHIEPGTFAFGDKLIMVGGENIRDKVYEFDPNTNDWNEIMTLPQGLLAPASRVIDGTIYVTHGATGGGNGNPTVPTQKAYKATFAIGVPNNPPSFDLGGDQTVGENAGYQYVGGFASNIDDGDGGSQTLTFYVSTNNPGLFSVMPTIDPGNGALTYTPAPNTVGTADVSVSLSDGFTTVGPQEFTITVTSGGGGSPSNVLYRINCGGSEMPDTPINWEEDKNSNPSPYLNSDESNNTGGWDGFGGTNTTPIPEDILGSRRWDGAWNDEMRWSFPVSGGDYEVRLYFVEYEESNGAGDRVFDIEVEGNVELNNFDPFAEAGYNVGFQKTIFASVTDGTLNIDFLREAGASDDPVVQAIEILSVADEVFPVEFTYFEARHQQQTVMIDWRTEQEENLSHFEVERSTDGWVFESVAEMPIGPNKGNNRYRYQDPVRQLQQLYYRIKAVDLDGTLTYSSIREVKMDIAMVEVFPNPTRERLNLRVNGRAGQARVQLADTQGQVILRETLKLSGALETHSYELNELPSGIYLLTFTQNGVSKVQKVFVR